jgi:photosystem II stability/assembly factor-like uncharacterized protein
LRKSVLTGRGASLVAALLTAAAVRAFAAPGFVDVLDTPAQPSLLAAKAPLAAVAKAGDRLVAVGQRGHVLISSDGGDTWRQARVPVSSDLTAVFLADAKRGWAVGHDGVILATVDGGMTWRVQLNGIVAAERIVAAMERRLAADPASARAKALADEAKRFRDQGADKPFLDVWFADARNGFAVGAYNLIFHTTDGGATWEPWFDRTDNPKLFNLYSIRPAAGALYIAGEGGLALRLDPAAQRFRAVATPYNGSFFGVADGGATAVLFGLRGNVFTSGDGGKTWSRIDARLAASVVASARDVEGRLLLADASGRVAASADGGRSFEPLKLRPALPITGFADMGGGWLAVVGPRGAALAQLLPH